MMQRHRPLFQEAVKHFGSWPAAIEAAGLVIVPRRLKDRAFTRESVLSKLLELSTVTDPLQGTKVKGHPGCSSLPKWAVHYFGSWDEALEAAGLPVPPPLWKKHLLKPEPLYPDAASVIAAIQARAAAGQSLLKSSLKVKKAAGGDLNLDRRACKLFGGWKEAVDAAGLLEDPLQVVSRRFWNAEDVVAEFRRRHAAGLPVAGKDLHEGPHKDGTLIVAAKRFYGTHRAALEAAGLPVDRTRIPHFTCNGALSELSRRYGAGERIDGRTVLTSSNTGRRLHDDLIGFFGTWKAVLKAAGIPENASRPPHPRHRFDSKSDIIRALRARLDAGQPVDLTSMNRPRSQGGDTSLVNYAREYYRSWGEAVRDAHAGA